MAVMKLISALTLPIRFVLGVAFALAALFVCVVMGVFIAIVSPYSLAGFCLGVGGMYEDTYEWVLGRD